MTLGIITLLDELAEQRAKLDVLSLRKQEAVDNLLGEELKRNIALVEANFSAEAYDVQDEIARLEKEVRDQTKVYGSSVKGQCLQAVFSTRTSWKTKALNGYAVAHPEILRFRTETPSVSIRQVKNG